MLLLVVFDNLIECKFDSFAHTTNSVVNMNLLLLFTTFSGEVVSSTFLYPPNRKEFQTGQSLKCL